MRDYIVSLNQFKMSARKRAWDPIMHDYVDSDNDDETLQTLPHADDVCPKGGVHDMQEHSRSTFCPDGDPSWIRYQCTKCGKKEVE